MYHYVDDNAFLGKMRKECSDLVNRLKMELNKDGRWEVDMSLVGSGAKNLITQNADKPIDLDYNLIVRRAPYDINGGRKIKEEIRHAFDTVSEEKGGWKPCSDSTSCLTVKRENYRGYAIEFSIDLAIIREDKNGTWYRLIHQKTGDTKKDAYIWNIGPSGKIDQKVDKVKARGKWEEVRQAYLDKKNLYLKRRDFDHPSYICYIEAVNEVYGGLR